MEQQAILKARKVRKYFPVRRGFLQKPVGWLQAVDDVSLEILPGQTLGLVGESGCGKSTLARLFLKLLDPDQGEILYRGREISGLSERAFKPLRKEIQIIFQDPQGSLNPKMTIASTLEDGLRVLGLPKKQRLEKSGDLLERVGLDPEDRNRYPHEFSGGQRQRIGLARALSVEPELIICDEPVSALDVSIQSKIINLLYTLQKELSVSYLFISHDLNVVGYLSHQVAVMYLGQIMEYASTESIFASPEHPYTRALLAATPRVEADPEQEEEPLSGDVPSPLDPPKGCRFHTRCPLGDAECRRDPMLLKRKHSGHLVRCRKVS
ncbi:MAG: ATP-binding cassette domain-containing protein [Desulfohalobiaceae bacterium]|nr:ATP-binding cassette domain-containing protein [Desulfohalobiaceae bacterium]